MRALLRLSALVAVAAAAWLPNVHRLYDVDATTRAHIASSLAAHAVSDTTASAHGDVEPLRDVNPEWDFMSRTFTVLGLANRALATPQHDRAPLLASIDHVIDETIATDARAGQLHFLLEYAKAGSFIDPSARSIFVDGELLMMIAARELVEPRAQRPEQRDWHAEAQERARRVERSMRRSPSLSGESYPNECWTFCNTTALAALAMSDRAFGGDHRELSRAWLAHARQHLLDPKTGLLVSSYTYDGHVKDGAEGSSIFMSAQNLLLVDEAFAKDQYARARHELGASVLGFGYAREWPRGEPERPDIDSGPTVPLLEASAGSSGFALLGASAFGDATFRDELMRSLELAAFPREDESGRRYLASNRVGDAVLFYALEFGPLWSRAREPGPHARAQRELGPKRQRGAS
ncbi:MAG TPA: hypothetical protein VLM85_30535 [Polyangiaceae bacterium]|nr:hypothetical protein [Polyangiaceae bacterium]